MKKVLSSSGGLLFLALSSMVVAALLTFAGLSMAQVPDPSPPTCVSCPAGYHCAHNPERCVPN